MQKKRNKPKKVCSAVELFSDSSDSALWEGCMLVRGEDGVHLSR